MTAEQFLAGSDLPEGIRTTLAALWHMEHGAWETAHGLVDDLPGAEAAWVHAHLHRVEGDLGNAGYWYRQAGKPRSSEPLEVERLAIARALLGA